MKQIKNVIEKNKWQMALNETTPPRVLCRPDCPVCGGIGFVRFDVPFDDPRFGKLQPCPNIPPESSLHDNHGLSAHEIRTLDWKALENRSNLKDGIRAITATLKRGSGMLYLYGGPGLAKSALLKIACAKWARNGSGIFRFTTQKELIDDIRLGYNDKEEPHRAVKEKEEKYIGFSLLAIDEVTAERNTEFKIEEFFHVINKRHEAGVEQAGKFVTLMAGNIPPAQLDYRIADRLSDGRNQIVKLTGESYRPAMEWKNDVPEVDDAPWTQDPNTGEWIR